MKAAALLPLALLAVAPAPPAAGQAPPPEAQATRPAARPPSPAARPFGATTPRARLPRTLSEPLGLNQPNASPMRQAEPAPIPNRSIEAPRDRFADPLAPSLEPMLLPPERRAGVTFGREHLRETGPDRPFDNIVPGARLRIPFEGSNSGGR
jgi:hypothetical protein